MSRESAFAYRPATEEDLVFGRIVAVRNDETGDWEEGVVAGGVYWEVLVRDTTLVQRVRRDFLVRLHAGDGVTQDSVWIWNTEAGERLRVLTVSEADQWLVKLENNLDEATYADISSIRVPR